MSEENKTGPPDSEPADQQIPTADPPGDAGDPDEVPVAESFPSAELASPMPPPESEETEPALSLKQQADQIIEAEIAQHAALRISSNLAPPMPTQFENLAANGGAVAAFLLGLMALIGSFFTDYSAINSVLGLCFCLWGLNSQLKILNLAGLLLCGIALAICIAF